MPLTVDSDLDSDRPGTTTPFIKSTLILLGLPMSKLREMLSPVEYETVKIICTPIPFPVLFNLPDHVKEQMSRTEVKAIEGVRILRFYTAPINPDTIEFKGHVWMVKARHHETQIRGSSKADRLPTVLTEYLGLV